MKPSTGIDTSPAAVRDGEHVLPVGGEERDVVTAGDESPSQLPHERLEAPGEGLRDGVVARCDERDPQGPGRATVDEVAHDADRSGGGAGPRGAVGAPESRLGVADHPAGFESMPVTPHSYPRAGTAKPGVTSLCSAGARPGTVPPRPRVGRCGEAAEPRTGRGLL